MKPDMKPTEADLAKGAKIAAKWFLERPDSVLSEVIASAIAASRAKTLESVNHCDGTIHCNTCADVQGADLH